MSLPPKPPAASPVITTLGTRGMSPLVRSTTPTSSPFSTNQRSSTPTMTGLPTPGAGLSVTARQTTPNKSVASRSSTPDAILARAGSASRTGSAPRMAVLGPSAVRAASVNKARVNLAKATWDAERATRSRSAQTATRKLRRWEMANPALFGQTHDDEDEDDVWAAGAASPRVDWRSLFSQLFTEANWGHMQAFRGCHEEAVDGKAHISKRRVRKDHFRDAEAAWLLVEKRLRSSVRDALAARPEMLGFVHAFEAVLMFFAEKLDAPPEALVPPALATLLSDPLTIKCKRRQGKTDPSQVTEVLSLRVNFGSVNKDAAFYRLIVHATAQFYGFKSASATESGARVTLVTAPAKISIKKTPMTAAQTSLAAFLGATRAEAEEKQQQQMTAAQKSVEMSFETECQ